VAHRYFKELEPRQIADLTQARLVVDAVNGLKIENWEEAGFQVFRLGVGKYGDLEPGGV